MIEMEETTTEAVLRKTYRIPAADTSVMEARVEGNYVRFIVGGTECTVCLDSIAGFSALAATVSADYPVWVGSVPDDEEPEAEETPPAEEEEIPNNDV